MNGLGGGRGFPLGLPFGRFPQALSGAPGGPGTFPFFLKPAETRSPNPQGVVGLDRGGDPVDGLFLLCLERAEEVVPDQENFPVILVQVFGVRTMVDPVAGWGSKEPIQNAEPSNQPGMLEDAPDIGGDADSHEVKGRNPQQGQQVEGGAREEGEVQDKPSGSNRHIVFYRGVMDMVHRPEKPRSVGNPVIHIPRQIIEQESDQPSGEILFQYEEVPPMIQEGHHPEGQEMPHCGIDYQSRNRDEEIGRGVGIVPGAVFGEPHPMSHPLPESRST